MLKLRDYQTESILKIRERFAAGDKRTILCLPTGAGKTVTFSELARLTVSSNNTSRVLILTDRIELLSQAGSTLQQIDLPVGFLSAKAKYMPRERVVVAMVETYYKRIRKGWTLRDLKLIIIDEAHKGNFRKILDLHPNVHVIGATATPLATNKKDPLKNYFQSIVVGTEISDLVADGFLSKPRYFAYPFVIKAAIKRSTGDYDEKEMFDLFDKPELYAGCILNYQKHANGKKTLIFCVNIKHTQNTAEAFAEHGYNVKYLTSQFSPQERKQVLNWFRDTPNGILVNCGILTTGFDEPSIECVILNRSTASVPLYLQMVGRGSRVTEKKSEFIIIDMGDNIKRLSFWDTVRDWKDEFFNPGKGSDKEKQPPVKDCPECEALVPARAMVCPDCAYVFPEPEEKRALPIVETQEVYNTNLLRSKDKNLTIQELIYKCNLLKKADGRPFHKFWVAHKLMEREDPLPLLIEFGRIQKYKSPVYWAEMFYEKNIKNT